MTDIKPHLRTKLQALVMAADRIANELAQEMNASAVVTPSTMRTQTLCQAFANELRKQLQEG